MEIEQAKELIIELMIAEMEATKRGKSTTREKKAARNLLKAICPNAKLSDIEDIIKSVS